MFQRPIFDTMNEYPSQTVRRCVVIPAAGRGVRFGGEVPKQYLVLAGIPILVRSVLAALRVERVDSVVVAVCPSDVDFVSRLFFNAGIDDGRLHLVDGGAQRQDSVALCLRHPSLDAVGVVLVHDAVRPLASRELWELVAQEAERYGAAIPGMPVTDTIKAIDPDGYVLSTLDRASLTVAQTPQGFTKEILIKAYSEASSTGYIGTDCSSLVEHARLKVRIIPGEETNFKITTPYDLTAATLLLS